MRRLLLSAALCLTAPIHASAATRVIPVAGHLPGNNGTSWTTDLSLTNNSTAAAAVDLVFRAPDGIARTRTVTLDSRQSLLLVDVAAPANFPGTNPQAWLGQLEVRSAADVSASAHIFTQGSAGGTYGSTYDSFDPAVLSTSGTLAGLMASTRFRSNVAFANPVDSASRFDYTLRREDGTVAGIHHVDVPPHSTTQLSVSDDAGPTVDDRSLSLNWTSTSGGYVVGSVIDNKSGDPTNASSTSRDELELFFPVVGRTPGSNATFWSTSAAVASRSESAGSVTFAYADAASGRTYTKTLDLPAHGTVRTDDFNGFVGAPLGTGSLRITATVGIVGAVRVFNTQPDGSTFGSSVLPQSNVVRASKVRVSGVRRDDDYRLNVGISNDDSANTSGVVRLFDDRGVAVETEPFEVAHGKSVQVPMNRGDDKVHAGEVEVETENGIAVTVTASNVDNRTGDTLQHEAEQENERQSELEIKVSPATAAAGAPVTFSLDHAGTNVASVAWTFGDGISAAGTTVTHTFATAGEYVVNAAVTLTTGGTVRAREDVHILASGNGTPAPAAIDFTFSPSAPAAGQQVVFTASGATSGGTFNWTFPGNVRKSGSIVTFTFAAAGSYEVEVELEREGSTTLHATHIVTVGGGTTTPAQTVTAIDFSWSPQTPKTGQAVSFTASFDKQPPSGSVVKWRFPDGSRPEGTTAVYTFAAAGTYTVRVQIEQPGQPSIEREKTVTVTKP
jgi:hypothetical protein